MRELHNAPATFRIREQLVVFRSNGEETIIQDTDGPVDGIFLADFDQEGRVLYSVSLDANPIAHCTAERPQPGYRSGGGAG